MSKRSKAVEILRHFPGVTPQDIACLENAGGFSGACLWKVSTSTGTLCLRKWPQAHPSEAVLGRIHGLLRHAAARGMTELPVPLPHAGRDTVLKLRQFLYELTPWMPGQADYHARPTVARLTAAMTVLGRFHNAVQTCSLGSTPLGPRCSPGLVERRAGLERLLHGGFDQLAAAVSAYRVGGPDDAALHTRAQRLLEMFPLCADRVRRQLGRAALLQVALQPCLRDIWHDHVLFTDEDVTGLIDFGAIRVDNVACDLARLTGSLVGDDQAGWAAALAAYQAQRSLSADEHALIRAFDQSGVLMSGLTWLHWICVEGRRFNDQQRVLDRLDENLRRLAHLCGGG